MGKGRWVDGPTGMSNTGTGSGTEMAGYVRHVRASMGAMMEM